MGSGELHPTLKGNYRTMANTTTGRARGYRGQKGGAHTLPWRENHEILARIPQVRRLKAKGLTMFEVGQRLGISEETVKLDLGRDKELAAENASDAREEHIGNLRELWRQTHELLEATGNQSLNKSALVGQLRQIETDIAKLDGSFVERSSVEATLHNGDRDLDAEIERLFPNVAKPRLLEQGPTALEGTG